MHKYTLGRKLKTLGSYKWQLQPNPNSLPGFLLYFMERDEPTRENLNSCSHGEGLLEMPVFLSSGTVEK